jgi:hypothetical protein
MRPVGGGPWRLLILSLDRLAAQKIIQSHQRRTKYTTFTDLVQNVHHLFRVPALKRYVAHPINWEPSQRQFLFEVGLEISGPILT